MKSSYLITAVYGTLEISIRHLGNSFEEVCYLMTRVTHTCTYSIRYVRYPIVVDLISEDVPAILSYPILRGRGSVFSVEVLGRRESRRDGDGHTMSIHERFCC